MSMEIDGEEVVTPSIYADSTPFEIPPELAFKVLDILRLAHIYVLKDSYPEQLVPDFNPHKWTNEIEFAKQSVDVYREMIRVMQEQPRFDPTHDQQATCYECLHPYYRHFDPYENNAPVGCKYCSCVKFVEPQGG